MRCVFLALSPVPVMERMLGMSRAGLKCRPVQPESRRRTQAAGLGADVAEVRLSRALTEHTVPLPGHPPLTPLTPSCSKWDEVIKTVEMHFLAHMWSQEAEPRAGCRPGPAMPSTRCP